MDCFCCWFWDFGFGILFLDIWYGGIIFLKLTGDDGRRDMPPLQSDKAIVSQTGSHVAMANKDRMMIRLNIFKGLINNPIKTETRGDEISIGLRIDTRVSKSRMAVKED